MIVVITGVLEDKHGNLRIAGAGKDEVAKTFVERGFVSVAFADIMKRFCAELFGFTEEQLWGESEERSKPDSRYPIGFDQSRHVTPRHVLQMLGDWGRNCYPDIWANYALEMSQRILNTPGFYYERAAVAGKSTASGSPRKLLKGVVIPDCRFQNEFSRAKEEGATLVRVKKTCDEFPSALDDSHLSERDILSLDDTEFDYIISNHGSLSFLKLHTEHVIDQILGRMIPYDDEQRDIPPFKRVKR